jgi:hypothetical protein
LIRIQDSDPDSNPGLESGFESGSETGSGSETNVRPDPDSKPDPKKSFGSATLVMCLNNFGPSWRFLGLFLEFPKIKSSPKIRISQITKYLNINPILTSHNYIQKIIATMACFCKTFISS